MKKNFLYVLVALATAAMVACDPQPKPDPKDDPDPIDDPVTAPLISIVDGTAADWAELPSEYVVEATLPENAYDNGLKSVKVFADEVYINVLVEINPEVVTDLSLVPFHIYLNTDNSDATGGYGDEFADANTDVLLETAIIGEGVANNYNPAVFHWFGEVGGTGWEWTDPNIVADDTNGWGAIVAEGAAPIGNSQEVAANTYEIQLVRELIPAPAGANWNETEFGIGFDVQQNWSSVGILPTADADEGGNRVLVNKLAVKIYYAK